MLSLHVQRLSDITDTPGDKRTPLLLNSPLETFSLRGLTIARGNMPPLVSDLTLELHACEKVAVTGPSGAGKSTLLALIAGKLTPDHGTILADGQPLGQHLDTTRLYSMLLQADGLIEGSVRDNIAFGDAEPEHARVVEAARTACIHEDILALPLAYREPLTEQAGRLSAGQRQRLLIARAVYRRAPVLLLDEATSHLDAATELAVMKNILALPGICFFVTHRSDIAALADRTITLGWENSASSRISPGDSAATVAAKG